MRNQVITSTEKPHKDYWRTSGRAYLDACELCGVGYFDIDVAASEDNRKCDAFIGEGQDALTADWFRSLEVGTAWCNPPFSRKVEFLEKAYKERTNGLTCMMIPLEPATLWWRTHVENKASVVYIPDGRYNFLHPVSGEEIKGVNFPSCFVVFTGLTMPTQYVHFFRGIGE